MDSQVVNLWLAGGVPRKESRTTGNVGGVWKKPCENEEDLCNPIFGRITTGKDGIFERTTKKKVETPRKKRTLFNKVSIINNFVEHAL